MEQNLVDLKKRIIVAAHASKEGHIPSAFSILDILWVLYHRVMNTDIKNPKNEERDRFVLSKGHASLGLYAVLASKGFIEYSELEKFGKFQSRLGGHPDRNKVPGVEASTGSLGHGFPIALGIALGIKIKKGSQHVYTLIGDGEANEGTVWETALLATHHNLDNLTCIVDYNHSTDRALQMGDIHAKFNSFGWHCLEIDGHDHIQILESLKLRVKGKPVAIIANTIKGKGCASMENNPAWHHKSPSKEDMDKLLEEIK